ncbi:hypothetical protein EVAR_47518_1 [Eumeta japonica]|uniref:Uncharacterized protein n=1 Tax=Eumeta variegata TaxID=151549 RepID=A0A4C1XR79_EUMVA|nr:hypothetical protein EVAR_47518_1 [Eumeta japonica]
MKASSRLRLIPHEFYKSSCVAKDGGIALHRVRIGESGFRVASMSAVLDEGRSFCEPFLKINGCAPWLRAFRAAEEALSRRCRTRSTATFVNLSVCFNMKGLIRNLPFQLST